MDPSERAPNGPYNTREGDISVYTSEPYDEEFNDLPVIGPQDCVMDPVDRAALKILDNTRYTVKLDNAIQKAVRPEDSMDLDHEKNIALRDALQNHLHRHFATANTVQRIENCLNYNTNEKFHLLKRAHETSKFCELL